jgi:flagellar motor switch protein FliM
MTQTDGLSQDEIDALLMGDSEPDDFKADVPTASAMQPYNPATQHRVISERLHTLDMINERFARAFREKMFTWLRRGADVTVSNVKYQTYSDFSKHIPMPANLNLITMKPLRGTGLIAFPPKLVYYAVDNLFGGDGRAMQKAEGKEFTNTEHRIIQKLVDYALDVYKAAWKSVFPVDIEYTRSEVQARFANVTSSSNEIVVNTTFHLEIDSLITDFNIALPFLMLEPIRNLLTTPPSESRPEEEQAWNSRMSSELQESEILMTADFVNIDTIISDFMKLKTGDILPIDLPTEVTARVDGVPVLSCEYGSIDGVRGLRVAKVINHQGLGTANSQGFVAGLGNKHA